jgi:integrase
VVQQKTREPARFELTEPTRVAVAAWMAKARLTSGSYLFPSRQHESLHLSVRQYARIVKRWVGLTGGNPQEYGTQSLRRTRATPPARIVVLTPIRS